MRLSTKWIAGFAGTALVALTPSPSQGQQSYGTPQTPTGTQKATGWAEGTNNVAGLESRAQQAINTFKQTDPTLDNFFTNSAAYAVFPSIVEGALIVGGAHGKGIVYQNGQLIGQATVTKGTVGAQAGGQTFSELIFFQTPQSFQEFKQGNFEFSAGMNAVAANTGVGKVTDYRNGVAVFTTSRSGLMAKAAIGGQKFTYTPLAVGAAGFGGQGGILTGASTNSANSTGGTSR